MNNVDQPFLKNFSYNAFLSSKFKILYLATPKVACTNMKWWFANLHNFSDEIKKISMTFESSSELAIHENFAKISPDTNNLNFAEVLPLTSSTNFLSFALVRNPFKRTFSAWQSKILLQEEMQTKPFKAKSFLSLPIENVKDIGFAFESFLEEIFSNKDVNTFDLHWIPQERLLRPDLINYSIISKIEDSDKLLILLKSHLEKSFIHPFESHSYNKSIIPYSHKFISERSAEIIFSIYEKDFSLFNYKEEIPLTFSEVDDQSISFAIQGIKLIRMRHEALRELRNKLHYSDLKFYDLEKHNADLEKHNADLEKHNADLEKHNADLEKHNADLEKQLTQIRGSKAYKFISKFNKIS